MIRYGSTIKIGFLKTPFVSIAAMFMMLLSTKTIAQQTLETVSSKNTSLTGHSSKIDKQQSDTARREVLYTVNFEELEGQGIDTNKPLHGEFYSLTDSEMEALKNLNPAKYTDVTLKDYIAVKIISLDNEGEPVAKTTYKRRP